MTWARAQTGRRLMHIAFTALTLVAPVAGVAAAASAGPSTAQLNAARLMGGFRMVGRVTDAVAVRGERRGDLVHRSWVFTGPCSAAPCQAVNLARGRSGGTDHLTLLRRSPATYTGTGTFVLPLICHGRRYPRGEVVPFTITVTVTEVSATAAGPVAGALRATYLSSSRLNLTPCLIVPAHDAARYTGALG